MKKLNGQSAPENTTTEKSSLELILRAVPGRRATALSFVRQIALEDDRYKELVRDYDADRKADLGDLCTKHGIGHAEFIGDINKEAFPLVEEAMKTSIIESQAVVSARLKKVVERGMIEGAKADGITDRHFILQKEGFHVAPKGMAINVNQINQQAAGLPSFEDETKSLADILTPEDHQLTEGETDYVDAIEEEVEVDLVEAKREVAA